MFSPAGYRRTGWVSNRLVAGVPARPGFSRIVFWEKLHRGIGRVWRQETVRQVGWGIVARMAAAPRVSGLEQGETLIALSGYSGVPLLGNTRKGTIGLD